MGFLHIPPKRCTRFGGICKNPHIAPLGWEHIRLTGDYHFAPQLGRSLENLRPLRLQEGEESA